MSGTEVHGALKESLCGYFEEKSISSGKLGGGHDSEKSLIKREVILDPHSEFVENRLTRKAARVCSSFVPVSKDLAKSKSLPVFKHSETSSDASVNSKTTDDTLMSATSIAREKKMSMIERMVPFMSPYVSLVSMTTGSAINFQGGQYEEEKLEKEIILPILRVCT